MEKNEVIQQVIDTIRKDVLTNKDFLKSILADIKLTEQNIPTELILSLMNKLNVTQQPPRPVSNAPKERVKGRAVAKPIAIGEGSTEAQIVSDLLEGNNVYLKGKAGTGKTYLAKAIADSVMGQPVFLINCSQWTSPIEIRGGQTIKGYEEGQLIEAWAQGGILILDELPKLDPNTAGLLNDALAEAASQPKYDESGKLLEDTIPYIVNGKGEKIYKGQKCKDSDLRFRFCVIGTGNTDMMNVGNKYSGNQRQDYSLVDRFAGSFYTIEADPIKEMQLTYTYVFDVCNAMRKFLEERDALQSISLRTMLNFNRTYEQEMLYKIESPFADDIKDNNGNTVPPKNVEDSIGSFLSMLEPNMRKDLENYPDFREARNADKSEDVFIVKFKKKYHLNPRTGNVLTQKEIEELG
jgi:cobaltochelatase CobS